MALFFNFAMLCQNTWIMIEIVVTIHILSIFSLPSLLVSSVMASFIHSFNNICAVHSCESDVEYDERREEGLD